MVIRQGWKTAAFLFFVMAMFSLSAGKAHAQHQCPAGSSSGSSTGTGTTTTSGAVTTSTAAQVQLQNALLARQRQFALLNSGALSQNSLLNSGFGRNKWRPTCFRGRS